METIDLAAEPREKATKGAVRSLRRAGRVPAVLYGGKRSALLVTIDRKEFETKVGSIEGTHLIRLNSTAGDIAGRLVLVKEVQRDPVERTLLHTDLYEVDVNAKLKLSVPLHFIGRAAGVDVGGILQPIKREVEVQCLPTEIPDFIEVDVSALGIHDALHLSDLKAPAGVDLVIDSDETVVTVLPPVVEEVKVAAEGEAAAEAATPPAEGGRPEAAKPAA
jgi:large subunit ribosomal protein L25